MITIFLITVKGHGITAILIQSILGMVMMVVGLFHESKLRLPPMLADILAPLCIEVALIISLPLLYMLQKWLDKTGRLEDSVYGHRPFRWGVISSVSFGGLILVASIVAVLLT